MAADPDPYFALPNLYGAPAYARPPRIVPESERPLDPDDLPIAAEQTDEERALVEASRGSGSLATGREIEAAWASVGSGPGGDGSRRLSLRTITGRLGPRRK